MYSCACLCALLLEMGHHQLPAHHHELGDAEVCNMQSAELAANEQFTFTVYEVHIHKDELIGQLLQDSAVPNNVVKQKDRPTSDLCDVDLCHPLLASSNGKDQLNLNILGEFTGSESFSEADQVTATCGSTGTQEVNVAAKQCTDISDDMAQLHTYEKLIREDSDHSIVPVGLHEIQNVDHDVTLKNDRDDLASRCSKSDHESLIVHDSWCSDASEGESCHNDDARYTSMHDSCSVDSDTTASKVPDIYVIWHNSANSPTCTVEQAGSYVSDDPEVYDMASSLDCENSKFADIPVDSRSQHVKLTLADYNEMEAVCSNEDEEQTKQNQLCLLFSCLLDQTEKSTYGFESAINCQQNSNCLNAGIYDSLGGMELRDDMELIPVEGGRTSRDDNTEGTESMSDMNSYLHSMKNYTSLTNDNDCVAAGICVSFGGMELRDDMELISVGDEKTDRVHYMEVTETTHGVKNDSVSTTTVTNLSSDPDRMYDNNNARHEFLQATADIPEVYKSASISHNEEHTETMSGDDSGLEVEQQSDEAVDTCDVLDRDDNNSVLPQPSDSGIRLLLTPEHSSVADQDHTLQCTNTTLDSSGQEMPQYHILIPTDEVCDSDNEYSEPTRVVDEIGKTLSMALASATSNVKSVTETENVDHLSLETIDIDSVGAVLMEVMDSSVLSIENGENEHSEVLIQQSDSGIRLLSKPEHLPVSDQLLQCTDTAHESGGQETPQCHLLLRPTDEVFDSNSEPTAIADEDGRTSSMVLLSAAASVMSTVDTKNVDTLMSLETPDIDSADAVLTQVMDLAVFSNASEVEHTYLNSSFVENEENENSTNTGCESTANAAQTSSEDLQFFTGAGFSETSIIEHHPDLLLQQDQKTSSTVCYANEDFQLSVYGSRQQLEPFTVDDASLHTQRLELDDLTLTVTCFIAEESEELLPDGDVLEHFNESNHLDVPVPSPPSSTKCTGSNPVMGFDLSHYIDHNIVSADKILPKRRSSEFMLSYLMPIDETAEFTDDASTDADNIVLDKSRLLQPADEQINTNTESGVNDKQQIAYNMSVSPNVEHVHHLRHELTERVQQDDDTATSGIENPGLDSSASNVYGFGMTDITNNGCKLNSTFNIEQIICKESHCAVEHFDGNVTLPLTANWQDTVNELAGINRYNSEHSIDVIACHLEAATNGTQVDYLLDDDNEHATTAEQATMTTDSPLHACSKDHITNSDDASMLLAATRHSLSMYSAVKTEESNVSDMSDKHCLNTSAFTQNELEGVNVATEHLDKNNENNNIIDLDMKTSADGTVLDENSVTTSTVALKCQNEPWKQSAETAMELCDRPVLQSSDMQSILDAILQGLVYSCETSGNTQHSTVEEQPLSHMATNERGASRNISSVLGSSSPMVVVKAAVELEEPAVDAVTDFESILEQLHCTEHGA